MVGWWLVVAIDPVASLRSGAVATGDDGGFTITAFARGTHLQVAAFRSDQGTRGFPAATADGAEAGGGGHGSRPSRQAFSTRRSIVASWKIGKVSWPGLR